MDVACKPIMEDVESIQKYLAILEKIENLFIYYSILWFVGNV